jgi:hypothetical protein
MAGVIAARSTLSVPPSVYTTLQPRSLLRRFLTVRSAVFAQKTLPPK